MRRERFAISTYLPSPSKAPNDFSARSEISRSAEAVARMTTTVTGEQLGRSRSAPRLLAPSRGSG